MAGGGGESTITLEYTPTWIVMVVCTVIVFISLLFERLLHYLGKTLKRKNQKPLFDALQKIKEELMLLGFISLLLVAFQGTIQRICVRESLMHHLRPCKKDDTATAAAHFSVGFSGGARRLLAGGGADSTHCQKSILISSFIQGKVPLLSLEAIHELHIFIFVLAVTHVVLSLITVVLGIVQMRNWRLWEDSVQEEDANAPPKITHVHKLEFVKKRYKGFGKFSFILSWMHSFFKQFYGSVTETDYTTMRRGFIMTHCKGNKKFNFYKYMIRVLEADFRKVVGISWQLWIFVMIFLLLNVEGWHAYFWISFIPLVLLLAIGTKLEHIITQLAHEVAEKHSAIEGDLVVTPSDDLFWFHRPQIVIFLIHFILFQNAFEIAYFFWILNLRPNGNDLSDKIEPKLFGLALIFVWFSEYTIGKNISQHMALIPASWGKWASSSPGLSSALIHALLVSSVLSQLLCSYSTLPLYAIVTQVDLSLSLSLPL
ncbi:hypothetical protein C4D60_Mb08t18990 [Musa balbisiana]|uniref:MLO-like protein n=1 Tax=Musa balbisiana TaxID=52838 RepID=A0A4S8K4T8_MUSBA|nr:hypothetical protein C4D60_Mb08t18990 [Musa balbisiana]